MFLSLVSKVESQLSIPEGDKSMKPKTTMMAAQYRLHEWAEQVRLASAIQEALGKPVPMAAKP